jgi:hypothetical protein
MAKRYNKTAFIASYHQAFLAGHTAEQLAQDLGLTVNAVHSRAFYLREGGLKLPRLRRTRKLAAKPVQVKEPTLGDELEFDTAFLHKPVKVVVHAPATFTITITTEGVNAAV